MPEVDYVILSEWFDWIVRNIDMSVDLIGERPLPTSVPGPQGGCAWRACQLAGAAAAALTTGDSFPTFIQPSLQGQTGPGGFWSLLVFVPPALLPWVHCDLMSFFSV